ncbi:hypothetical protein TrRE_jg6508 [Triparma retinervis]|uniref:Uncharacterized protein n=1 Tax=Triparma retinervis TaxID=2557542 RepID=A0A9W7FBH4_9STRA|nr:hypothetical protein TrRE_jg6508 [Triparma retinervis]
MHGSTEGNGRMSWNFSVVRPIFGLLSLMTCYVVDNHRFFRVVAAVSLIFQVCTESIAAFDVARALRTLQSKCTDSVTGLQLSSDCLSPTPDNYWSEYRLTLLLRRDIVVSFFLLISFFFVLFLGVTIGFTREEYSYSQIHTRYNHQKALWQELNKHGITVSNFKRRVKSGAKAGGSLDTKFDKDLDKDKVKDK